MQMGRANFETTEVPVCSQNFKLDLSRVVTEQRHTKQCSHLLLSEQNLASLVSRVDTKEREISMDPMERPLLARWIILFSM